MDPYATVGVQPEPWFGGLPIFEATPTWSNRFSLRTDYLRWRTRGMDVPPLVTSSPPGTPLAQAGVLDNPDTVVLFGNDRLNDDWVNGLRLQSTYSLRGNSFGLQSEYYQLSDGQDGFNAASDGTTILTRPYFDVVSGDEASELIAFPNVVTGSIVVASESRLRSYMLAGRASMCPIHIADCGCEDTNVVDWLAGYRYLYLRDQLAIGSNVDTVTVAAPPTNTRSAEFFQARNEFNGLQLGTVYRANFRRAWLDTMMRVAIGANHQQVSISGLRTITGPAGTNDFTGALLAQRTNIGNYERDQFTMVPDLGFSFGVRITQCLHATLGYSVLYFPRVVRAGDQIETDVNPNLIPPEAVPFTGALRPRFRFIESDYWAHGLNLGAEFRF
jgi:hypothetical protein